MTEYTQEQQRYIDSVEGNAHQSAVDIILTLEVERDQLRAENARLREAAGMALGHISFVNQAAIEGKWPALVVALATEKKLRQALEG